ncbi:peptidylprolyl isomerase [candidate division KSB1 bacterium]
MRQLLLNVILILILLLPGKSPAQEVLDGVVAIVNDEIILHSEVLLSVREEIMTNKIDPARVQEILPDIYQDALKRLIEMKVVVVKAVEDSIVIDDEEINQRLDMELSSMEQQFGSREEMERRYNTSYRKIRDMRFKQLRELLLAQRLRANLFQEIKVSRDEVEEFFALYKDSANVIPPVTETYELSHILKYVKPAGNKYREKHAVLESISARLGSGEDFDDLAEEYKNDTKTGIISSDIGWVNKGLLNPEFENAVTSIDSGEITGIVRTTLVPNQTFGFHIIINLGEDASRFHAKHIFFSHSIGEEDMAAYADTLSIIKSSIDSSTTFKDLALIHSDDNDTKEGGGFMGEFPVDHPLFESIPEFKDATLKTEEGEVSDPFRTNFGYHLVYVSKVTKPRVRSLGEDWEFLLNLVQQRKSNVDFEIWLENAMNDVYIEYKPLPDDYVKKGDK